MKVGDKKMFDIDSMYMMLKEFNFDDKTGKFETIKPDMNKDVKDMNLQQRNNLLIDIMTGVLTHPDTASKQINPGNFDGPKATARRVNILASGANYKWPQLEKMSLEELDEISEKNQLNILDFTSQVKLHQQNMTAAKLIGIIANHSTNHAVRQNTEIEVNPVEISITDKETKERKLQIFDRFRLNGRFLTSLHDIVNPTNTAYISKNFASFLAASVDAVKDPVLSFFNLNTFTADSAMLLTGLGYDFDEIGLLLRQPAIEELVRHHERNSRTGMTKAQAIEELLDKYKNILEKELQSPVSSELSERMSNNFTLDRMAEQISLKVKLKELNTLEGNDRDAFIKNNYGEVQDLYKYQYQVLLNYKNILDTAQELSDFVSASRADTSGGGAGPTIADTKLKMRKIQKNIDNANPEIGTPVLANTDIIEFVPEELLNDIDKLRDHLRDSKLGFIQGFTTLGLQATERTLSQYFPHYSSYFTYIFNKLEDNYLKSNKLSIELMNQLYNDFFTYYMSQFDGFSREGSDEFIRDFPIRFLGMKNSEEELNNLQLIKSIKFVNPSNEVPVAKLKFNAGGRLSSNVRDTMIMEWESLLYQPKYRQLAFDLFRYNYYVNGFSFGTTSFIHLAPAALKMELPNFTDNLYKLLEMNGSEGNNRFTEEQLDIFIDQFYRNHLGNKKLVPEVTSISPETFQTEEGQVVNTLDLVLPRKEMAELFTINGDVLPYVMVNIKGDTHYFKVSRSKIDDSDRIITHFEHIQPLGIRNNFLEYDFANADIHSNIASEDYSNVNDRDEYRNYNYDVTQSQDAYEYDYNPEPASMQELPEHLREQFNSAFQFMQEQNDEFKTQEQQAFETLTEDDAPAFVREYNQSDNDITNSPDTSDAFQSLVDEVGKEQINKYKENC